MYLRAKSRGIARAPALRTDKQRTKTEIYMQSIRNFFCRQEKFSDSSNFVTMWQKLQRCDRKNENTLL